MHSDPKLLSEPLNPKSNELAYETTYSINNKKWTVCRIIIWRPSFSPYDLSPTPAHLRIQHVIIHRKKFKKCAMLFTWSQEGNVLARVEMRENATLHVVLHKPLDIGCGININVDTVQNYRKCERLVNNLTLVSLEPRGDEAHISSIALAIMRQNAHCLRRLMVVVPCVHKPSLMDAANVLVKSGEVMEGDTGCHETIYVTWVLQPLHSSLYSEDKKFQLAKLLYWSQVEHRHHDC